MLTQQVEKRKIYFKFKNDNLQLELGAELCKPFSQKNEQPVSIRWLIFWNLVRGKF